jgi:hypothetical protein
MEMTIEVHDETFLGYWSSRGPETIMLMVHEARRRMGPAAPERPVPERRT